MSRIERAIAAISPSWALKRERARTLLKRSALYNSAKTNRLTNPALSSSVYNVNDIIGASAQITKARVQDLIRNFPSFARAVNVWAAFSVGSGITFQSKITDADGKLDTKKNQEIEDAWNFWADEADFSGKQHFYEIQDTCRRQDCEAGEWLIVERYDRTPGRYLPYALQVYEADILDTGVYQPRNAGVTTTEQGIEYNTESGRPLAYWIQDEGYGKSKRVPANQVLHGFKMLRPNQLRGISPFAPGVVLASDLAEYMADEMSGTKMASKWLAFVTTDSFADMQAGLGTDTTTGRKQEEINSGMIEYLLEGQDVKIASNPRPGTNFEPFVKLVLTMFSSIAGPPYELISADYAGMKYTNLRAARNDWIQILKPEITRTNRQLNTPVNHRFMDFLDLSGKVPLPGYAKNPHQYYKAKWNPPGVLPIDPLKENKAAINAVDNLLASRQDYMSAQGKDFEEVMAEIEQEQEIMEEKGIQVESTDTSIATANNPAAVEDQA